MIIDLEGKHMKKLFAWFQYFWGSGPKPEKIDTNKLNMPNHHSWTPPREDLTFCPRSGVHYDDVHDFDR